MMIRTYDYDFCFGPKFFSFKSFFFIAVRLRKIENNYHILLKMLN